MTSGSDRLDRIEGNLVEVTGALKELARDLKQVTGDLKEVKATLKDVAVRQREMTVRQQYHDEAFERFDVRMKVIQDNSAADGENIRALARIAELHNRRLEGLAGGEVS